MTIGEQAHETQFLEVPTDEYVWMTYAAAAMASGEYGSSTSAKIADSLLEEHRQRWPNAYKSEEW
jgi:hypothetical protein